MKNCENTRPCPCTASCSRHGKCCECVDYHTKKGQFPGCFFTKEAERDYDRSLNRLLSDRGLSR